MRLALAHFFAFFLQLLTDFPWPVLSLPLPLQTFLPPLQTTPSHFMHTVDILFKTRMLFGETLVALGIFLFELLEFLDPLPHNLMEFFRVFTLHVPQLFNPVLHDTFFHAFKFFRILRLGFAEAGLDVLLAFIDETLKGLRILFFELAQTGQAGV